MSDSRLVSEEERAHNNLMMVIATLTWLMLSCLSEIFNKNEMCFENIKQKTTFLASSLHLLLQLLAGFETVLPEEPRGVRTAAKHPSISE